MNTFEELVSLLIEKQMTIASAESCTGGLFASHIVDVPDASRVLNASVVTYSNAAKVRYARVSYDTIEKFGAVSEQVAGEMAEGIALETSANVGVSFSGVAGPTGGSKQKPVGTVCVGCYIEGKLWTHTFHLDPTLSRAEIREQSTILLAEKLLDFLNNLGWFETLCRDELSK
ncbi:MAG: nicotinamide-nucleotide amidohydrolase family protein [Eubacterium sp.]|nr:nicotinamide-nucleotide amidohydrolase family protein [Eubacterium sp.]